MQHNRFQMPPNNFPGLRNAPQMPSFPPYDMPVLSQMPFLPNGAPNNRNPQHGAQFFTMNNYMMPPSGPINLAPDRNPGQDGLVQEIKVEPQEHGQQQQPPPTHRLVKHTVDSQIFASLYVRGVGTSDIRDHLISQVTSDALFSYTSIIFCDFGFHGSALYGKA